MSSEQDAQNSQTWSVHVLDLWHYDEDCDFTITGFPTLELATEYARRRTRSSFEEARSTTLELSRLHWIQWGESCFVVGGNYSGNSELQFFFDHPATPEEIDFAALERK